MSGKEPTRIRVLLRRGEYRRLFVAQTISRWGDTFNVVALAILVFRLTGSGLGVGGVVVAEILPVLLLGPVAGAVIDRLPRVRVMIVADLWRMALAAALPLVDHSVGAVYVIAFGLSAGAVFFNPASASVLPHLVTERELLAANSGLWTAAVISQVALAPAAGALVAFAGVGPAFLINAASFAAAAAVLARLKPSGADRPAVTEPAAWVDRVRHGLRELTADPFLRVLSLVQLFAALSAGATSALLIVLAERQFGVDARGFGVLLAAIGVGAATGPLVLNRFVSDPRRLAFVFGPFMLRGVVDLVLATFRSFFVGLGALAAYGVGTSTGMVTYNSFLQAEVRSELRGRVFAGFDMLWQLGRLISIGLGGALADAIGIRAVYYMGGVLLLVAGLIGFLGVRTTGSQRG